MHEIFVNYRTNDAHDAAFAIQADLVHRFGEDKVFFASRSLSHAEPFPEAMIREAVKSRVLLAVIGPDWLKRDERGRRLVDDEKDWVRKEITAALDAGTVVIPILVGRRTERLPADLPAEIKDLVNFNYCRFDHREAQTQLPQIAAAVQEVVAGLVDVTKVVPETKPAPESPAASGGPAVSTTGQSGGMNFGGGVNTGGGTFIGSSHGPVHTGSGSQFTLGPVGHDDSDDPNPAK